MRFFKAKKKEAAAATAAKTMSAEQPEKAEALQDMKSELDSAVVPELKAKAEEAPVEAANENVVELKQADVAEEKAAEPTAPLVRLFPGFEGQPFEIGYAGFSSSEYGIEEEQPMLLMRWKAGSAKWFPLPQMFNKAVLEQIHEEDNDLDRLLIGYGYDAEQLVKKPE